MKSRSKYLSSGSIVYYIPLLLILTGIFAPYLANDKPLAARMADGMVFPLFSNKVFFSGEPRQINPDTVDWKSKAAWWPPVVYLPGRSDFLNLYAGPFDKQYMLDGEGRVAEMKLRFRHWLGTGKRGDDVLAGLIYGARVSLLTGFLSMLIALLTGVTLGTLAGYSGDRQVKLPVVSLGIYLTGLFLALFYAFVRRQNILAGSASAGSFFNELTLSFLIFGAIMLLAWLSARQLGKSSRRTVFIPVDSLVMRLIEIVHSVPLIILVLFIASVLRPSYLNLVLLMGLTLWTGIARLVRAEVLRVRELDFVTAARSLGYSRRRIIFRHVLPSTIQPAIVAFVFGNASAILLESSLSFLGAGVPPETVTWGSLISAGKENYQSWWLVVFPGLAIFLTIFSYNRAGEKIRDRMDPLAGKK